MTKNNPAKIDLNCDTGEGVGNEEDLMPHITACNIACGGHAGTPASVQNMLSLAKKYKVKVGAHPSLPDKENFGRKFIEMPPGALMESLLQQITLVKEHCDKLNLFLHHIKMHGALYNKSANDEKLAELIINLIQQYFPGCILYVPYQSLIAKRATGKIKIHYEGFADRNYNDDHSLVSRVQNNAIISDREAVFKHCYEMIAQQQVTTVTGKTIPMKLNTLCVHGDSPKAVALVSYLKKKLSEYNLLKINPDVA